jgi:urate oxidase
MLNGYLNFLIECFNNLDEDLRRIIYFLMILKWQYYGFTLFEIKIERYNGH